MYICVLDIETTGLSLARDTITVIGTIVYDVDTDTIFSKKCFNVVCAEESESGVELQKIKNELIEMFDLCTHIVAFNGIGFDIPFIVKWLKNVKLSTKKEKEMNLEVCDSATTPELIDHCTRWNDKHVDFCRMSLELTGKYISLQNICTINNIEIEKSSTGLQAVHWAKERKWKELEEYCMQDVLVLLSLTQCAVKNGLKFSIRNSKCHKPSPENLYHVYLDESMKPVSKKVKKYHEIDTSKKPEQVNSLPTKAVHSNLFKFDSTALN